VVKGTSPIYVPKARATAKSGRGRSTSLVVLAIVYGAVLNGADCVRLLGVVVRVPSVTRLREWLRMGYLRGMVGVATR